MKERPILFSAPMVRAILEGRKTQTRRVVTPQNCAFGSAPRLFWEHADFAKAWVDGREPFDGTVMQYLHVPCHSTEPGQCATCDEWGWPTTVHRLWPRWWPYKAYVGDEKERPPHQLWVRESFQPILSGGVRWGDADYETGYGYAINYVATGGVKEFFDCSNDGAFCERITPSIHMPRWASRIQLEITDVRVQRVQEISEKDAVAEGSDCSSGLECSDCDWLGWEDSPGVKCDESDEDTTFLCPKCGQVASHHPLDEQGRMEFRKLWDAINAKRGSGWDKNPWVWALSFKRIEPAAGVR